MTAFLYRQIGILPAPLPCAEKALTAGWIGPAGIYVQNDNGTLSLKALNNIRLTASDMENVGKDSHTEIVAGRDLTLDTLKVQQTENSNGREYNSRYLTQQTEMGSRVNSGGNLNVQAGQDISLTASQLGAQNSVTLLAGQDIHLNAAQTLHHQTDNGYKVHQISGKVSHISSSDKLALNAGRDITAQATMTAKGPVQLVANRDIHLNTAQKSYDLVDNGYEVRRTSKEVSHISSNDKLSLNAGRDISTQATVMAAESSAQLIAGRNMTHGAIEQADYEASKGHKRQVIDEHRRQQVTEITSGKNTTLTAGHDLILKGTQVQAQNDIAAQAGHDIALKSVTESDYHFFEETKTKRKRFSKTTTHTVREDFVTHEKGAILSGNNVQVVTDHDITMLGSAVAGEQKVAVIAGNDINVMSSAEQQTHYSMTQKKKSGLFSGGGIGFTIGKAKQKSTTDTDSKLSKGSTVGSSQGSVTLNAGQQLNIHGSDAVAGRDMQLSGQNINITSAENSHTAITKTEQKQSGLTVALSGTAGGALNSAVQTVQAANNESDSRLKALQGTKAALSGVQAVQAARLANAKGGDDKANNNLVGVSLSYGSQSSRSELKQHQTTQQGSSLMTGDNLTLTAAGTPDQNGDILIQGGQLQAGKDLQLNASRDIQLSSSQNTEQTTGKNSSRGGSLGVGLTAGPGGTGINLSASANYGKGRESGNGVSHNETTLDAGQTVTLNAGRDATLKGAQVSGEQITADVKRHLTLSSEQDSNRYDMKQQNVSAGVSATIGSGGSLNLSASRDKIHSNFDSVQEQTGLFAGQGGYQVKVGEHTQLDGAVIASTADKDKNTLDTGTLGFGDIKNKADFKTEHHSVSVSTGGSAGGMFLSNMAANTLGGANREGHAQSTTHAAVSGGALIIRDKDNQQQDITTLSRDTDHANNALSPIFDKEKEQQRLKQAQLIGEISAQVIDIASTEGAIIATKAAHAKLENISDPDRKAAIKALEDKGKTDITPELIKDQIYKTAYNQALNESGFGTGGKYHTALQAATAAIQGLAGGNIGQALAGGASPYLAGVIKDLTTDPKTHQVDVVSNTLAHAILGAVAAEVSGNNALAGAAGAAGGELAARELMKHIHGENVKVSDLSEEEKQTISTLSTLAAGLAGGIAGDSTGSAVTGAQAGKNAVENNALSLPKGMAEYGRAQSSLAMKMYKEGATPDQLSEELARQARGTHPEGQDPARGLIVAWGNFFGVPLDVVMSNEQMTPEKAAEIVSSGIPTSEAKVMQYVAAKTFLALAKNSGAGNKTGNPLLQWSTGEGKYSQKNQGTVTNVESQAGQFDGKTTFNAKDEVTQGTTVKAETSRTLIYHENFGGHAIERHVGKSDAQLLARFKNDPTVVASSTFTDMKTAEWAIGNGIAANREKLTNWLTSNVPGAKDRIVIKHDMPVSVGRVIQRGSTKSHESNSIVIVIDKDPLMPNGYRIQTAYPK
ncbi:hemagglutinin repeat-containing protein [Photorhabdus asymbiotica UENP]